MTNTSRDIIMYDLPENQSRFIDSDQSVSINIRYYESLDCIRMYTVDHALLSMDLNI
jgi:hypothetical protein